MSELTARFMQHPYSAMVGIVLGGLTYFGVNRIVRPLTARLEKWINGRLKQWINGEAK